MPKNFQTSLDDFAILQKKALFNSAGYSKKLTAKN